MRQLHAAFSRLVKTGRVRTVLNSWINRYCQDRLSRNCRNSLDPTAVLTNAIANLGNGQDIYQLIDLQPSR